MRTDLLLIKKSRAGGCSSRGGRLERPLHSHESLNHFPPCPFPVSKHREGVSAHGLSPPSSLYSSALAPRRPARAPPPSRRCGQQAGPPRLPPSFSAPLGSPSCIRPARIKRLLRRSAQWRLRRPKDRSLGPLPPFCHWRAWRPLKGAGRVASGGRRRPQRAVTPYGSAGTGR